MTGSVALSRRITGSGVGPPSNSAALQPGQRAQAPLHPQRLLTEERRPHLAGQVLKREAERTGGRLELELDLADGDLEALAAGLLVLVVGHLLVLILGVRNSRMPSAVQWGGIGLAFNNFETGAPVPLPAAAWFLITALGGG